MNAQVLSCLFISTVGASSGVSCMEGALLAGPASASASASASSSSAGAVDLSGSEIETCTDKCASRKAIEGRPQGEDRAVLEIGKTIAVNQT